MSRIIKHYSCAICDEDEDVVMTRAEADRYEPSVTCGGCGAKMEFVGEDTEPEDDDDDETEDGIPYGPIGFLNL